MILALLVGAASFGVAGPGCEQKAPTEAAKADADAGNDKYVTADSKLTKALQAAASSAPATDNGPPPEGVFALGVADQRVLGYCAKTKPFFAWMALTTRFHPSTC